ncbi:hypothetical protein [Synechococcus sp. PCC 7336]|uniref:hypothetical protein n=1 Tax=Synechococcus sp. PCC 7336 TaxID=195250 RepID=UPI00034A2C75|nr:hypothetical protein [Synechococcus sp. PCC 7336]
MKTISVSAHFDGKHILLDEPLNLEPNAKLIVTVLPQKDTEREAWNTLAVMGLVEAYDPEEEEYPLDCIKIFNLDYE